ncbi:MAG: DUF748 domain-containing protein [Nitrospirales bacterium]|nr:DUF748 domain-containing protein [Nitrospirales bacterium]
MMTKGLKIFLMMATGFFVLYAVVGFWGIPWAITNQLPPKLSEQLSRSVTIQEARFNPFVFTLQIKGFDIEEKDGSPLVGFDELYIDFEIMASLVKRAYDFSHIRLGLPYGLAIVRPDGVLNLADLQPSSDPQAEKTVSEAPQAPPEEGDGLPPVFIEQLSIQQGMVEFQDISRPTPFVAHVVPINITLENFSTQKGKENPYSLSAELSHGEKIMWEGSVVLEPLQSQGSVALENIQLPDLWAYLQDQFRFDISQGSATLNGRYEVSTVHEGVAVRVNQGNLTVKDLQVRERDAANPVISIPRFAVKDVEVDVAKHNVRIPSIEAQDARFTAWIEPDGVVNYQPLFTPTEVKEAADPEPVSPDAETSQAWNIVIQDLALDNFAVDFEDRQPEVPVKLLLEALHFHTSDVDLAFPKPLPIDLAFQFNQTGKAQFQGNVGLNPLVVDLDLSLSDIALQPFQPYVEPFVQFTLGSGALGLQGHTHFQKASSHEPLVIFQGQMGVNGLALEDPTQAASFLKWDNFTLKKFDLQVEPTALSIEEVALVNPTVVLSIDTDGGMNMKRLFVPPGSVSQEEDSTNEPASETKSSEKVSTPVKIGSININNLLARFADASVSPNVVTQIEGLTGTIKGLSSDQLAKADVKLEGTVDRHAPFRIEGQINPLSEDAYTDVIIGLTNFGLPTVSPYSATYTGYPINKGKLSLDLGYKISEKTLVGENKVLIDQITMGEKIESPNATSLPIPLALALLKDRKGQIDIDLPVRGNLDDPDFSYGGVIWNALANLLTKIATSPFAMLGGLMGEGGDDLQFVAFSAGQETLLSSEQEKLTALGKALGDRPGLRLDITGAADPQTDRPALAWAQLRKQLQKRKFIQNPSAGQKVVIVENIELTQEEEARLILEMYTEKFGPLPQAGSSSPDGKPAVTPTPEELKAKLLDSMQVEEAQIRLLAQQRAQHIHDYLIQETQVSGDRIFLVESNLSPVTEGEMVRSPLTLAAN